MGLYIAVMFAGPAQEFALGGYAVPTVRPIEVCGSDVLHEKCEEIRSDYPGLEQLIRDMFATLDHAGGVGLAAPQIGLPIRLFIADCTSWAGDYPELSDYRRVFINPEIYFCSEEHVLREEGCLSFPEIEGCVSRSLTVRMRYLDEQFRAHDEEFGGVPAWVIQHEYDHIEGIVFTDRMDPSQLEKIKGSLAELSERAKCAEKRNNNY